MDDLVDGIRNAEDDAKGALDSKEVLNFGQINIHWFEGCNRVRGLLHDRSDVEKLQGHIVKSNLLSTLLPRRE